MSHQWRCLQWPQLSECAWPFLQTCTGLFAAKRFGLPQFHRYSTQNSRYRAPLQSRTHAPNEEGKREQNMQYSMTKKKLYPVARTNQDQHRNSQKSEKVHNKRSQLIILTPELLLERSIPNCAGPAVRTTLPKKGCETIWTARGGSCSFCCWLDSSIISCMKRMPSSAATALIAYSEEEREMYLWLWTRYCVACQWTTVLCSKWRSIWK